MRPTWWSGWKMGRSESRGTVEHRRVWVGETKSVRIKILFACEIHHYFLRKGLSTDFLVWYILQFIFMNAIKYFLVDHNIPIFQKRQIRIKPVIKFQLYFMLKSLVSIRMPIIITWEPTMNMRQEIWVGTSLLPMQWSSF